MKLKKHQKSSKQLNFQKEIENKLREEAFMNLTSLFEKLDSSFEGLSNDSVCEKQDRSAKNIITVGKKNTMFSRLIASIVNPFNLILIVIAIVTYFTDVVFSNEPDYITIVIIVLLVMVSSLVAFVQGEKSNNAAEKLSKLVTNYAEVYRDNQWQEILIEDVVVGDIVRLSAGDMIPADVRFLTTKDTFVAQAALTGESQPVEKFSKICREKDISLTDISNLGFIGSNVISGSATAIVLGIGNETYFGSMAKTLSGERAKNSFERGIDSVSKLLVRMMILVVPVVFLINGMIKKDYAEALLFAISIAVGLTPEMLPVIMTSTLAKGAVSMSKHKVIVKSLGTIQAFGEMDILCTDKTGTLTEDKIVLEKYMNLHGEDDYRVLRHAYLNSYFQTGLKNLIDHAIINRANKKGFTEILDNYERVDEIPFDFSRRRMSVVIQDKNGKRQLITKGAVEEMIDISSFIEINGQVVPLDEKTKKIAIQTYEKHNNDGLRIIAVAQKNNVPGINTFSIKDELDMVLIGFIGFLDPPKESSKSAIIALKEHGVRTIVLTGDSGGVTAKVCNKVGINTKVMIDGLQVERMSDEELTKSLEMCDIYYKLSPSQKERIVHQLQLAGHTVGFMGDGINDAPALRQADVGISVDSAVDIAKETADIILLEKDLMVLEEGVLEGRKTFGNINKYIKMAASGNFGNIISVVIASLFLPFFPMLPIQILAQNLLNDFAQMGIPFDKVDPYYIKNPQKWDTKSIQRFMYIMGPISTIFDLLCFVILWWVIGANTKDLAPLFQSGWFVFGTISQILVIYVIRTRRLPFIQSTPSKQLLFSTLSIALVAILIAFTNLAITLDMYKLPINFLLWLILLSLVYILTVQVVKKLYIKKYSEWL